MSQWSVCVSLGSLHVFLNLRPFFLKHLFGVIWPTFKQKKCCTITHQSLQKVPLWLRGPASNLDPAPFPWVCEHMHKIVWIILDIWTLAHKQVYIKSCQADQTLMIMGLNGGKKQQQQKTVKHQCPLFATRCLCRTRESGPVFGKWSRQRRWWNEPISFSSFSMISANVWKTEDTFHHAAATWSETKWQEWNSDYRNTLRSGLLLLFVYLLFASIEKNSIIFINVYALCKYLFPKSRSIHWRSSSFCWEWNTEGEGEFTTLNISDLSIIKNEHTSLKTQGTFCKITNMCTVLTSKTRLVNKPRFTHKKNTKDMTKQIYSSYMFVWYLFLVSVHPHVTLTDEQWCCSWFTGHSYIHVACSGDHQFRELLFSVSQISLTFTLWFTYTGYCDCVSSSCHFCFWWRYFLCFSFCQL